MSDNDKEQEVIAQIPIDQLTQETVDKIISAKSTDELKQYTNMFNMNIAKKSALRIIKLNSLLDSVTDQAIRRFEKKPDEVSNKEILDYMKVVQDSIKNSQADLAVLEDPKPLIQINNQKNEVNVVNVTPTLTREGRERVTDAVMSLLAQLKKAEPVAEEVTDNTPIQDFTTKEGEDK